MYFDLSGIADTLRAVGETPAERALCMLLHQLAPAADALRRRRNDDCPGFELVQTTIRDSLPHGFEQMAALEALAEAMQAVQALTKKRAQVPDDREWKSPADGGSEDGHGAFRVGMALPCPRVQVSIIQLGYYTYFFSGVVWPYGTNGPAVRWGNFQTSRAERFSLKYTSTGEGFLTSSFESAAFSARNLDFPCYVVDHAARVWYRVEFARGCTQILERGALDS